MDVREDVVDILSGFSLFADLTTPELESLVDAFGEEAFQPGERVLRQGLTGSNFYVILEGTAAIRALFGLGLFKDVRVEIQNDVVVVIVEGVALIARSYKNGERPLSRAPGRTFFTTSLRLALSLPAPRRSRPRSRAQANEARP